MEYCFVCFIFDRNDELIGMDRVVLVHARSHLEATEFAGIAASNCATANAAYRHTVHLSRILRVVIVHDHATALSIYFGIIYQVPANDK